MAMLPFDRLVFCFYYLVGIACQIPKQVIGCRVSVNTYPMLWRQIMWFADTTILCFQFIDSLWLALERDDSEVVAIKE